MVGKIIKLEDAVKQNIETQAQNLLHFYKEEKVVELLREGENIASYLLKNRETINNDFNKEMEDKRKSIEMEAEVIKQRAYKDGLEEIRTEVFRQFKDFFSFIETSKLNLENTQKQILKNAEQDIVELTLLIAEKVILSELKENKKQFIELVKQVIGQIAEQKRIVLKVCEEDYELFKEHLDILRREAGMVKEFAIEVNSSVHQKGVVFEMESGQVDMQIESQIESIRKAFKNA